jgi:TonB family protein
MFISRAIPGCLMVLFCGFALAQNDATEAINEGWNLYYQANFTGATAILERIDRELEGVADRRDDKIRAKLGLALCYIGQNRAPRAEDKFVEILVIDPAYSLDATQHPPKVIAAFNAAKPRAQKLICDNACLEGQRLVVANDSNALRDLIKDSGGTCACVNNLSKELGRIMVEKAKQMYAQAEYTSALKAFQEAVQLDPSSMEARTYIQFCEERIKIARESLHLEWKAQFGDGHYDQAMATFQKIKALDDDQAKALVTQIEAEYQKLLDDLLSSYKDACAKQDQPRMHEALTKATAVDPAQTLNRSQLDQMKCEPPPQPPPQPATQPPVQTPAKPVSQNPTKPPTPPPATQAASPPASEPCLRISPVAYMQKIVRRVEPEYPSTARRSGIRGTVRMQITVDPDGKVSKVDVIQGHPMLAQAAREAVERWEFKQTLVSGSPVCVTTEIGVDFK